MCSRTLMFGTSSKTSTSKRTAILYFPPQEWPYFLSPRNPNCSFGLQPSFSLFGGQKDTGVPNDIMVHKVNYICMSRKGTSLSLSSSSLLGTGLSTDNVPVDDLWHHSLNLCTGIPPHIHCDIQFIVCHLVWYTIQCLVWHTHTVWPSD